MDSQITAAARALAAGGLATSEKVRAIRQAKPDRATKSRAAGR